MKKEYRGKKIFTPVFQWVLNEILKIYDKLKDLHFKGFHLTVWKESPFNKNNQIVELYKRYGFNYHNTQIYSEKRTYIHMLKDLD